MNLLDPLLPDLCRLKDLHLLTLLTLLKGLLYNLLPEVIRIQPISYHPVKTLSRDHNQQQGILWYLPRKTTHDNMALHWIRENQIFHHKRYLPIVPTTLQESQDLDLDLLITAIVQIVLQIFKVAQKPPIQPHLVRLLALRALVMILLTDLS